MKFTTYWGLVQDRRLFIANLDLFHAKSFGWDDPGGIHECIFAFSHFVYEPADFLWVFSGGTTVDDDEHQEQVPVLDGVKKRLKAFLVKLPVCEYSRHSL
jgi:hypothetical protein